MRLEHVVAQQCRDPQRRGGTLGARQPAIVGGREDHVVAALQMLHHVGPLAAQVGERRA